MSQTGSCQQHHCGSSADCYFLAFAHGSLSPELQRNPQLALS
jgi:hypothetical protein